MNFLNNTGVAKEVLLFGQWSRKKYAVFLSIGRTIRIGVLCMVYSLVNRMPVIMAQQDTASNNLKITELQQIEIKGHRNQAVFSELSRIITVIHSDEVEKAGIQSLQDLLEYVSNIDIRQRGLFGVQSDVSIRGGSFDHVMILLNGINLSDPQTGHASLDLPIDKECIERIEILEGSAARVLGSGAFTGAINIVTRYAKDNRGSVNQYFGKYGFLRTNINCILKGNKFQHILSAGISTSKGYTEDTDFNTKNAYYRGNLVQENTQIDFQAGVQEKEFGAAGFYSPRFPNQFEETGLWFASIRASSGQKVKISPLIYIRRRKDHFILDRDNPVFYENFHLTNIMGSQVNFTWTMGPVLTTTGFDLRSEHILSNNLGFNNIRAIRVRGTDSMYYTKSYGRDNFAYFQEYSLSLGNLDISGGFMINWNSAYPDKPVLFPGLDISYRLIPDTRIYFSFNRGLNLPTFTDLFYVDPVNQGNIQLNPNRLVSFEGGLKQDGKNLHASVAFFRNTGQDIIDWLWSFEQSRFSPVNLQHFRAFGIETSMVFRASEILQALTPLRTLTVNYVFMDLRKSAPDSVSKYYNIRHKFSVMISHGITKKIEAVWTASYQVRSGEVVLYNPDGKAYYVRPYRPYWLLDGSINWKLGHLVLHAILTNVMNTKYIDAGSVMQPGRWFKAGITLNLGSDH